MSMIHSCNNRNSSAIIPFVLIISFISCSELISHFLVGEYLKALVTFVFSLLVFLIPVFLFRKNLKLYLKLLFPLLLIVPLNLAYVLYFHSRISEATVLMVLNTNK